jgi:hypothetical protein
MTVRELGLDTSEIRAAIGRDLNDPEAFPRLRESPDVRRVLSRLFPYRVLYMVYGCILRFAVRRLAV